MKDQHINIEYDTDNGLTVNGHLGNEVYLDRVPIRVRILGYAQFNVWHSKESGEDPPLWAESEMKIVCFGSGSELMNAGTSIFQSKSEDGNTRTHAICLTERARVELLLEHSGCHLSSSISVSNPQGSGKPLPLCSVELIFDNLSIGDEDTYLGSHAYGGWTHHSGEVSKLTGSGAAFVNGCIGLGLPVVYLSDPVKERGIELEFVMGERPVAWLKPGSRTQSSEWRIAWSTERLLEPGESHTYGGVARLSSFRGGSVAQMRKWRDEVKTRFNLAPPKAPDWMRRGNIIEFNMNPEAGHGFARLDDLKCRQLLERWSSLGYNVIHAVSCNHVGQNWLSPVDYKPRDEVGGIEGERQALAWAHDLGFHIYLWVTTVGIDRDAEVVKLHPEWFTHRANGELFYAWNSDPPDFESYAPDGDPLSAGWRHWLSEEVRSIIDRGYDGIYVDGLTPRASNHNRYNWPGQARNGVEGLVRDLAEFVRSLRPELITFVEDESFIMQANCEVTQGRYHPTGPYFKKFRPYHGPGGDPELDAQELRKIQPDQVREYLLVRHASLLPGVVSNDILEGYFSEAARPWTVQSLLSGIVPKTHSEYIEHPEVFIPADSEDVPPPGDREKEASHRKRGFEEFVGLLKFCINEPLIRGAPLSIEGVSVTGPRSVVGMIRPAKERILLCIVQFGSAEAEVRLRLSNPVDIPAIFRESSGVPEKSRWRVVELIRSMVDRDIGSEGIISGVDEYETVVAPYGFRVFELVPVDDPRAVLGGYSPIS